MTNRFRFQRGIATFLAAAVAAAGCGGAVEETGAEAEPTTTLARVDYTGEQLFAGVLLQSGPAAALVADVIAALPAPTTTQDCNELLRRADVARNYGAAEAARAQRLLGNCSSLRRKGPVDVQAVSTLVAEIARTAPSYFASFKREVTSGDHVRVERALIDGAKRAVAAIDTLGPRAPTERFVCVAAAIVIWAWAYFWVALFIPFVANPQGSDLQRAQLVQRLTERLAR